MSREELDLNEAEKVTGGAYVNATMTVGDIIKTDRRLAGVLAQVGISSMGNRAVMGMSLYEVAQVNGIDPYELENKLNDYLS